ncbi:DNA-directed RNA polymerase I subunit RPA12 [Micractinium conductrix]|uniref:DNA-directed RNA polymerase I subunit RPA12 n=1 Tax=Micractinium conductrix TaxID=554055 RepID=A0A2P6VF28_9CHLO|nr:DNA-directed RNA polymerase I subunit RPA12 [Micractinium conductrix]|eukprot:PSC72694.1 DNA-directed RNA polymerase I subunit RPA12 [Micractinium conductrix]
MQPGMLPDDMEPTPGELLKSSGDVIEKNWMFCPISGSLLILDTAGGMARSELAIFERPLSDLDDTMNVVTHADMPDYHRRYNLEPLIKSRQQLEFEALLKQRVRATVEEPCPKCQAPILEYYTMQLRSADEGQTVFYECRKCDYRYSTNN